MHAVLPSATLRPTFLAASHSAGWPINPLNPNINFHILLTILLIYLMVLVGRIWSKNQFIWSLVVISFILMTVVMRCPAKKNAGYPKVPRDFPPRKDGILSLPSGWIGTPLPLPQSLYGRAYRRTLTSQPPKFVGSISYQISLSMVLRSAAFGRKGAPLSPFA